MLRAHEEPRKPGPVDVARAARKKDDQSCLGSFVSLLARGFWPIVIYPRGVPIPGRDKPSEGKEPIGKAWGLERWTLERAHRAFKKWEGAGVGICLGPGRGPGGLWLVDIEGDGPEAEESRAKLLGGEPVETMGWDSTRGGHRPLTCDGERLASIMPGLAALEGKGLKVGVYKTPELPGLELRIGGYKPDGSIKQFQSVVPPTPGTDGRPRTWTGPESVAPAPEAFYRFLSDLAGRLQPRPDPAPVRPEKKKRAGGPKPRDLEHQGLEDRARAYLQKCDPAVSGRNGHDQAFKVACNIGPGFDLQPDTALRLLREVWNPTCVPPWSDRELEHKVEDAFKVVTDRGWLRDQPLESERPAPDVERNGDGRGHTANGRHTRAMPRPFNFTDLGNAERLVTRHGKDLKYCHPWKRWLVWDGRRWDNDKTGEARRRARETVRAIYCEAADEDGEDRRKAQARWAMESEKRDRIAAMLNLAEPEPGMPILPDQMDLDPWSFNCKNGTIDLRAGELRPHRRSDLITKLCPLDFDPEAGCELWMQTLDLFFAGNRKLIDYFQAVCGYALTGVVRDHIMPIAYGKGSNGKSTMLGTLLDVFGPDYAMKCPPDMLMAKKTDSHPTDRADLFGKRLVVAIETESGRYLNETMVKELTGGDKIRARRMREDFWEFDPTHTLILATNHKPSIRGTDDGVWRRLRLIPFEVQVVGEAADKQVPEKLKAEYPGILAWCVRGCLRWQAEGLVEPDEVVGASSDYRKQQDVIGSFIDECIEFDEDEETRAGEVFARYLKWCEKANEHPMSQTKFGVAMEERDVEKRRSGGIKYVGIKLSTPVPIDESTHPF